MHTLAALAEARGEDAAELARADRRERDRRLRAVSGRRRRRQLGQHFLVDENILGVIERLAELGPTTSCSRSGPGLGILTRFLADRVAHVHAVELDRSLEPHLARHPADDPPLAGRARARPGDARPAADASSSRTCRTTSPRRSSSRASTACPAIERWCVMVQREVADRFFAVAGHEGLRRRLGADPARDRAHRLPPGLARGLPAAPERRLGARRVPAHSRPGSRAGVKRVVEARVRPPPQDARELARARRRRARASRPPRRSRRSAATPPSAPRSSQPPEFVALAERARDDQRRRAPAKINLALVVGPTRRRRPARGRDDPPAHRPLRHDLARAAPTSSPSRASPTTRSSGARSRALAAAAGVEPRWRARIEKRIPVAAGLGGGSSDAATALRLANELARTSRSPPSRLHDARARPLGADVPFFLEPGPQLGTGDGSTLEPLDLPQDYAVLLAAAARRGQGLDRRRSTRRFDGDGRASTSGARACSRSPPRGRDGRPRRAARRTTSPPRRSPPSCATLGAFRADVSGAGPTRLRPLRRPRRGRARGRRARPLSGAIWVADPAW